MSVLVLSEHDVRALLDMESCIEAMEDVLAAARARRAVQAVAFRDAPAGADASDGSDARPSWRRRPAVLAEGDRRRSRELRPRARSAPGRRAAPRRRDRASWSRSSTPRRSPRSGPPPCPASRRSCSRGRARARSPILGSGVQGRSHVDAMQTVLGRPIDHDLEPQLRRTPRRSRSRRIARGRLGRGGARRRRRRLHHHRVARADRRARVARARRARQRGRRVIPTERASSTPRRSSRPRSSSTGASRR